MECFSTRRRKQKHKSRNCIKIFISLHFPPRVCRCAISFVLFFAGSRHLDIPDYLLVSVCLLHVCLRRFSGETNKTKASRMKEVLPAFCFWFAAVSLFLHQMQKLDHARKCASLVSGVVSNFVGNWNWNWFLFSSLFNSKSGNGIREWTVSADIDFPFETNISWEEETIERVCGSVCLRRQTWTAFGSNLSQQKAIHSSVWSQNKGRVFVYPGIGSD